MKKTDINGRSMIEMLAVLAIVAVLSIGGLYGYSKAVRRHRLNETISQIALMVVNIHSFFGNQDSYETLNERTAVEYNIATQRMRGSGNTLYSPYQGRINFSLDKASADSVPNTAFVITYRDLPLEACVALAKTDWGHGEKYGFLGLAVGADGVDMPSYPMPVSAYYTTNHQMKPLTTQEAVAHCTSASTTGSQSVVSLKFF